MPVVAPFRPNNVRMCAALFDFGVHQLKPVQNEGLHSSTAFTSDASMLPPVGHR
jgi:hypothetical protein